MSARDGDDLNSTPIFLHPRVKLTLFKPGQDLFNEEKFYEAHEEWEKLWKLELGVDKIWIQGLIQVAGHFVLIQNNRYNAAYRMALHSLEKLAVTLSTSSVYRKYDLDPITSALHYNVQILAPHLKAYDGPDLGSDWKEHLTGAHADQSAAVSPGISAEIFLFPKLFETSL